MLRICRYEHPHGHGMDYIRVFYIPIYYDTVVRIR